MRVLGIDEAGRGCVFGDLVVAGFLAVTPDEDALRAAGAADSKALTHARRVEARARLREMGEVQVRRVAPRDIDDGNINALEEAAIVDIVIASRPDHVFVDALGHPSALPRIVTRILDQLPDDLRPTFTMAPKADATWAVVGAASIFAKTVRDELLDELRPTWGELGSGYPSDPKTRAWLDEWARKGEAWPSFVRTRWSTVSERAQTSLF